MTATGALDLAVTECGNGVPMVILHGLLGRARNWQGVARDLVPSYAVRLPDLRNHGASPWSDEMDYPAMAGDVAALIERWGAKPTIVLGHSMGGKVAMTLALNRPELVARLILVDIAPIRYAQGYDVYIRALQAADLSPPRRRGDVDAEVARAIPDVALRAFLMQNLQQDGGALAWQPNLAVLLRAMPELMGFPELSREPGYGGAAWCLRGARSDYVDATGEAALRRLFPQITVAAVSDAGHWPHAEQPAAFFRLLTRALSD